MELIGKLEKIASHGHGVKIDGVWYTTDDASSKWLKNLKEGETVRAVWEKEGKYKKIINHIASHKGETKSEEAPKTEKTYSKSYDNNKSDNTGRYINRQSALKSAASVLSGTQFNDPAEAQEAVLMLANVFVEWIEAE